MKIKVLFFHLAVEKAMDDLKLTKEEKSKFASQLLFPPSHLSQFGPSCLLVYDNSQLTPNSIFCREIVSM